MQNRLLNQRSTEEFARRISPVFKKILATLMRYVYSVNRINARKHIFNSVIDNMMHQITYPSSHKETIGLFYMILYSKIYV